MGDIVVVKRGEKIPVDGEVIDGRTAVDEEMLTGESIPVEKDAGSKVAAATLNKTGSIKFRAEKVGKDTALAQIIKLVEDTQGTKAPIAKLADVVSSYFIPIVIALAVIAAIAWAIAGRDISFVLTTFVAVLVIACPFALGLATLTAIMVGTGKGATMGVLIKNAEALETLEKVDVLVVDKTGTLTEGKPKLVSVKAMNDFDENEVLALGASLECASEHPLA